VRFQNRDLWRCDDCLCVLEDVQKWLHPLLTDGLSNGRLKENYWTHVQMGDRCSHLSGRTASSINSPDRYPLPILATCLTKSRRRYSYLGRRAQGVAEASFESALFPAEFTAVTT